MTSDKRETDVPGGAAVGHRRADLDTTAMANDPTITRRRSRGSSDRSGCRAWRSTRRERAIFGEDGLKNPDFLLYPRFGTNLVVEVKGKRARTRAGRRDWENWVTTDDLDGAGALAGDVRARVPGGPGLRLRRADPAVPAAARQRGLRVPGAGVPLLGRRPGRLHRPPPIARAGLEGRGDGPPARSAAASGPCANGCR